MAGITIREATLDDKEAVLAIHDHVYDGRDYLPQFYDEILSSPSVTAFVLVHEETIVSIYIFDLRLLEKPSSFLHEHTGSREVM